MCARTHAYACVCPTCSRGRPHLAGSLTGSNARRRALDAGLRTARPCPAGSWSAGGDASQREPASCTPCPAGFTTTNDGASAAANCSMCAAGRGGAGCALCPANTFAAGSSPAGEPCSPCADGTVSAPGAASSDQCLPAALALRQDYFLVLLAAGNTTGTNSSRFVTQRSISTAAGCQDACVRDDACMQFRFSDASARCQLQREDASGSGALGFKVAAASGEPAAAGVAAAGDTSSAAPVAAARAYFVVYSVDKRLSMGRVLQQAPTSGVASSEACMAACSARDDCEGFLFGVAAGCSLLASKRDTSYSGMVHVVAAKLVPAPAPAVP